MTEEQITEDNANEQMKQLYQTAFPEEELQQHWWPEDMTKRMNDMVEIVKATKDQAKEIARLIMMAMTDDCCLHFCGEGYGLDDFHKMMTLLVEREDSQYSYTNTLVAVDGNRSATIGDACQSKKVVGISVSYDGGRLHELRLPFLSLALEYIGKDNSGMDDETQAGELYLDSLAVLPKYDIGVVC